MRSSTAPARDPAFPPTRASSTPTQEPCTSIDGAVSLLRSCRCRVRSDRAVDSPRSSSNRSGDASGRRWWWSVLLIAMLLVANLVVGIAGLRSEAPPAPVGPARVAAVPHPVAGLLAASEAVALAEEAGYTGRLGFTTSGNATGMEAAEAAGFTGRLGFSTP